MKNNKKNGFVAIGNAELKARRIMSSFHTALAVSFFLLFIIAYMTGEIMVDLFFPAAIITWMVLIVGILASPAKRLDRVDENDEDDEEKFRTGTTK